MTETTEQQDAKTMWEDLHAAIRNRWSDLTSEDLESVKQKAGQLVQIVQDRYGISVREAKKQVRDFEQSLESRIQGYYKSLEAEFGDRYRNVRQNVDNFTSDVRDFGLGTTLVDVARHNPLFALGTAFTLGFLLHASLTPRRKYRW